MLTVADKNFSYKSCDGLTETWKHMFYDSEIACNMSLSHGKASYIMSDGIGPVLLSEFISDVQQSGLFTLHFDEATRMDGHKQCDILVRYWSKNADKVVVSFYKAIELGHATGDIVSTEILNALDNDGLSLKNLLMLSGDGPNVNKTIHRLINDAVVNLRDKALLDIGTCTLHIAHNAFGAGISEYGKNTQELAMDLHAFFHASGSRWLTLANVLTRINGQMSVIVKMWKEFQKLPSKEQPTSSTYKRIQIQLQKKDILLVCLEFVVSVSKVFEKYLCVFQKQEPMIHILQEKMVELIRMIGS